MSYAPSSKPWMGPLPAAAGCDCQICRPEPGYDAQDRRSVDTVLQHGWQVLMVSDGPGCCESGHHDHSTDHATDDHGDHGDHDTDLFPAFAYTVGLGHRCGHPELLMSGLDPRLMHSALNSVAERVLAGLRLAPGDVLEGVLGGVPVVLEQVSDDALRETVSWSGWFHRRKPEALMLVWPTTTGLFAWQPGAPAALDEAQPPAWRVPIEHHGGAAVDPDWPFPVPPEYLTFSCTHVVNLGHPILWVARQYDPTRGEDWSVHCGALGHADDDVRGVHLAHLVRSAPSLRGLSGLALDTEALRIGPDADWQVAPLPRPRQSRGGTSPRRRGNRARR